jgi:ABC-type sugar transport system substrate-binding protein
MKRLVVIVLSMLMVLSLFACQGNTAAPAAEEPAATQAPAATEAPAAEEAPAKTTEGMKIAYFVSTMANEFHQARAAAAIKYAKEKYGAEVTILDGKSDDNTMINNVDMLATSDYDAAVLHVWQPEAVAPLALAAIDSGVAMMTFFSPLLDTGIPVYRSDEAGGSFAMGASAAEQWVKAHPDKPVVTVQLGWPDHTEVRSGRTDPFVAGIESVVGAGNYTNLGCIDSKGSADATKEAMANILITNPDVNIIYSEAGDLTPGCMAALVDAGRGTMDNGVPKTEIVASVDCPVSEVKAIYDPNSSLKMSLGLPPIQTSEKIIDVIVGIYLGEIPQFSQPAQELFGDVYPVDFYKLQLADVITWYNTQFGTTLTEADILG